MFCNVSLNTPIACSLVRFLGMTSSLACVDKYYSLLAHYVSSLKFLCFSPDAIMFGPAINIILPVNNVHALGPAG